MDAQKSSFCINVIKKRQGFVKKYVLNNLVVFWRVYGTNNISI